MKKAIFNGTIALLTIIILSACFNVYFGIGYILLILSHELGHWCAAKQLKAAVEFGGFTPVGAYVKVKQEDINSCKENAYIALGGPLLGVIISALCYVLFLLFGNDTFLVLAFVGVILNLANLIPCYPFDGGQIVESISPWFLLVGIPILLFFVVGSRKFVILLIVFIIGLLQTINTLTARKSTFCWSMTASYSPWKSKKPPRPAGSLRVCSRCWINQTCSGGQARCCV